MKRSRGYTLVESVGVISTIGVLLTLSVLLLHKTYDSHYAALMHLQRTRSLDQFIERWRDDIQSATHVTPEPTSAELRIAKADQEVVYSIEGQIVVRTRRRDGKEIEQDRWQLPSQCTASWKIDDQGHIPLLVGKLKFDGDEIEFDDVELVTRIGREGNSRESSK